VPGEPPDGRPDATRPGPAGAAPAQGLPVALATLRDRLLAARFPLQLPGAAEARHGAAALARQLDDHLLPRLGHLDAPVLAVVGGSTGAGKSTLVNSLVGQAVSEAGVLRPTTREPVLVCHPDDAPALLDRGLPGTRVRTSTAVSRGLALLDAPDIDSVAAENRDLAQRLLGAADMWLFVTTASRYADAVPWQLLLAARDRGTAVALVLDRVPAGAGPEVQADLQRLLDSVSLGAAPVFPIPEVGLGPDGLLPSAAVEPMRGWLSALAGDAVARDRVVRWTLDGALDSLPARVAEIAAAADVQDGAGRRLREAVGAAYGDAAAEVDAGISDGSLLRGEVLARWQELVGTGDLMRSLEAMLGRTRDRLSAVLRGRPAPARELGQALESSAVALVRAAADGAAARVRDRWADLPGGQMLLDQDASLGRASRDLDRLAEVQVRAWQARVFELVRGEGLAKRATARMLSFGVNGAGVVLMVVVFAHTGGLTGGEVAIAGGTGVLAQRLLEAIFGGEAVRRLASRARADLAERVGTLLDSEAHRFEVLLDAAVPAPGLGDRLRADAAQVSATRAAWAAAGSGLR
jgi:hypothetical protein